MGGVRKLLREPLVQFLLIGVAIFGASAALGDRDRTLPRDRILVTEGRVQQLARIFTKTWQRPPTAEELLGLVESFVKEEIYYREAVRLGLDRDDTVIRRRMQQKMQFLTEPPDDALTPTDAELEAFLADNRHRFYREPRIAFRQVFINPATAEGAPEARVERLLAQIRAASPEADLRRYGDATMLPYAMAVSSLTAIARAFGRAFAESLATLPQDAWTGPIRSAYGMHLVRITARKDGYHPPLAEIRQPVLVEWQAQRRAAFMEAEYERLRDRYDLILPDAVGTGTAGKGAAP